MKTSQRQTARAKADAKWAHLDPRRQQQEQAPKVEVCDFVQVDGLGKLPRSDAESWLRHRAGIIEACRAEGYSIVTTAQGVRLMKIGKVEAQAAQQAQAPERLALDMLCGLAGEVSTDDPMTAAERIFDHVQAERAAHVQELKNYRRNLEGRDALINKWRAGMREIIPQRMGAEAIRERLQSLLRGDVPQQGSNT